MFLFVYIYLLIYCVKEMGERFDWANDPFE